MDEKISFLKTELENLKELRNKDVSDKINNMLDIQIKNREQELELFNKEFGDANTRNEEDAKIAA